MGLMGSLEGLLADLLAINFENYLAKSVLSGYHLVVSLRSHLLYSDLLLLILKSFLELSEWLEH